MNKSFSVSASSISVSPSGNYLVDMDFEAEDGDVLGCFTLKEVIEYFGQADLLDEIGKDVSVEHFDIEEQE